MEKLQGRCVAAQDFAEESLGLAHHVRLQAVVEVLVVLGVDGYPVDTLQIKPLHAELFGEAISLMYPPACELELFDRAP